MSHSITITHRPFGSDHPYQADFDERRPRDPSGGDMVVLGFLTRPGGAAEAVRVEWRRNGRVQPPIHGRALASGTDEDHWLVELGVVEAGDTVAYRIVGRSADGAETATGEFAFATRAWRQVTHAVPLADGRYALRDRDGNPGPALAITHDDQGLRFEVAGDGETAAAGQTIALASLLALPRSGGSKLPLALRWQEESGRLTSLELTGGLTEDEALVGFGERFDALNQRGRAPDCTVYEQYKNQGDRTYLPVPFFLSSAGYGLLVEGTAGVAFDLGRTVPDRWRCIAAASSDGRVAIRAFAGAPDPIVRAFTALTGRPRPLPLWAYGPWMSSNEWNTQARVEREVAETVRHAIPATVLVIEAWSDETTFYIWNGAEYAPRAGADAFRLGDFTFSADGPWPDPKGMTEALHERGIRLVLWQIPALKALNAPHPQHNADVAHALDRELVLTNEDGTPYRNPFFWFRDAHIPDFTNPETACWWMAKRRYLLAELGIDGFKTDGGEHLAGRGLRAHDGRRGDELVNAYPMDYVRAYHEFATEQFGGDALTFSRAGYTGAGAVPAHWAGDENSTWEAFRRSLVAGLSAGISGVIFWGWDIAGFSDALPSTELYARAAAMAAFCPIMQYHSEYNPSGPSRDRTPWNIAAHTGDPRALELYRRFARIRLNLLPYIAREAEHAASAGTPLMRALLLDDPADPAVWRVQDQYRFGRSLLVAPVVAEGAANRTFYLPAGIWIDLWSGERFAGPGWTTVAAPWDRIPVFAPAGAVIPLRLGADGRLGGDTGNGLSLVDGLTYWLAVDPAAEAGAEHSDPALGIRFAREADGRLRVTLPAIADPSRVAAAGYATAEATGGVIVLDPEPGNGGIG